MSFHSSNMEGVRREVPVTYAKRTEEEQARGEVAGFHEQLMDGYFRARPIASARAADLVRWSSMESRDESLAAMLQEFGDEGWQRAYRRHNKLVFDPVSGMSTIVNKVPTVDTGQFALTDATEAQEAMRSVMESKERVAKAAAPSPVKKKIRYAIVQLFEDTDLRVKLGLSVEFVALLSRMAIADINKACSVAQDVLSTKGFDVVVYPGGFSKSLRAARSRILRAVETTPGLPALVDVVASFDKVMITGGKEIDGISQWYVSGPLWRAQEATAIARLATVKSSVFINKLFERDMLVCGIQLLQQTAGVCIGEVVPCSGPMLEGTTGVSGDTLPECVRDASDRVTPVVKFGKVIGSAVLMTTESSLVNWHVAEASFEGDGGNCVHLGVTKQVAASMVQSVGHDLWMTTHATVSSSVYPWFRRPVRDGESARFAYATLRGVEYSDVVQVLYVETGSVVTTLAAQVRGGLSGAALVSDTDGALLGVLHGYTYDKCVCSLLTGEMDLVPDGEVVRREAVPSTAGSDELFDDFSDRGLAAQVSGVAAALDKVYMKFESGLRQVATTVRTVSGVTYTTANPNVWSLCDSTGAAQLYKQDGSDRYALQQSGAVGASVGHMRQAVAGERICIIGNDVEGPFFSQVLSVLKAEVGSDRFWLDGVPTGSFCFTGGVILAVSDAAVLGQYVMREGESTASRCVSFAGAAVVGRSSPAVQCVSNSYPGLHCAAWELPALTGVLASDPAVLAQYVGTGKAALRSALMLQLARQRDDSRLMAVQGCLDNSSWLLNAVVNTGFSRMMDVVHSVGPSQPSSTKLVEIFMGFVGLAAVHECSDSFHQFVMSMGLVDAVVEQAVVYDSRGYSPISVQPRPLSWSGAQLERPSSGLRVH